MDAKNALCEAFLDTLTVGSRYGLIVGMNVG
jgi:hypothetical protein